ncbi:MAG: response regulator transcription factor, partial [Angelakisella sp.]
MFKVLIVEDDEVIARAVESHTRKWGYESLCVTDFKDVLGEFAHFNPHLVLLDISLPFFNGYHWCTELRRMSKVPIIFISSTSDKMNIVLAMNMGADDFIAKPFDLDVLVSKMQALLRRSYDFAGQSNILEHNGVLFGRDTLTVTYNGTELELTKNEGKILSLLMEQTGRTVSRETIMKRLWESDDYIDDNTLTVNVNRLRKRLAELGIGDFISTRKG